MKKSDTLCDNCPLRGVGLAHMRDVANGYGGIMLETLRRGQPLATGPVGTTYAFLRSGALKIEALSADGTSDVIGLVLAGEPIVVSHADAPIIATALQDSKICRLSVPAILGRDDRSAVILSTFCASALQQAIDDQQRLGRFRRGDATDRLAAFLADLSARTETTHVRLPMSRIDIASYLSLRPESVSRALATLEKGGHVVRESIRTFRLLDRTDEARRAS